jgi:hypothetical protein
MFKVLKTWNKIYGCEDDLGSICTISFTNVTKLLLFVGYELNGEAHSNILSDNISNYKIGETIFGVISDLSKAVQLPHTPS